jgi:hypothetical protein
MYAITYAAAIPDEVSRHKRYGLLQPLDIPYRPWTSMSMDFVTALPESDGYTQIWVIVDHLTKMAHFIPLRTGEGSDEGSSESPVKDLAKASSGRCRLPSIHPSTEEWSDREDKRDSGGVQHAGNAMDSTCRVDGYQPSFRVGDMVMIDARHFATKRPSKKLDHKKIGPVRMTALIGKRAVRVELPPTMRKTHILCRSKSDARSKHIRGRSRSEVRKKHILCRSKSEVRKKHILCRSKSEARRKHIRGRSRSEVRKKHILCRSRSEAETKHI